MYDQDYLAEYDEPAEHDVCLLSKACVGNNQIQTQEKQTAVRRLTMGCVSIARHNFILNVTDVHKLVDAAVKNCCEEGFGF